MLAILLVYLVLTAAAYLAYPILLRIIRGRLPKKKALIHVIINVIVVKFLFLVLAYLGDAESGGSFTPAFIYGFIAYKILKERQSDVDSAPEETECMPEAPAIVNDLSDDDYTDCEEPESQSDVTDTVCDITEVEHTDDTVTDLHNVGPSEDSFTETASSFLSYWNNVKKSYESSIKTFWEDVYSSIESIHTAIKTEIKNHNSKRELLIHDVPLAELDFSIYVFFRIYCNLCSPNNHKFVTMFGDLYESYLKESYADTIPYDDFVDSIFDNRLTRYDAIMQSTQNATEDLALQFYQFISKDLWSNDPLSDTITVTNIKESDRLIHEMRALDDSVENSTLVYMKNLLVLSQHPLVEYFETFVNLDA
jgi:hypothetical protein